jgi:hypothetical protein
VQGFGKAWWRQILWKTRMERERANIVSEIEARDASITGLDWEFEAITFNT